MTIFEENNPPLLSACVYCHNYTKGEKEVLYLPKFQESLKEYPLFSKQEMKDLGQHLKKKLSKGKGLEVLERFDLSILKPSKKLLEHTGEMINNQQIFHLIDEQITAYKTIMGKAKKLSKTKEKSVIIVPGGPGTGKSVIALEVMGELLRKGIGVVHATGSSAFTNTLRKILGVRSAKQFKFFNSFMKHKENEIEVLICDEAHRIRKTSESIYTPKSARTGEPQRDELIRASKLSVFFLDEHQIVRPNEIGSVSLIKDSAKKFGAEIYEMPELQTQFRCGGSGKYLDWIEKMLQIKEEGEDIELNDENKMEFKVVDSPQELKRIIEEKNKHKKNCARIVAGFCWP
jgi:DNA replication protein DnaC